MMYPQLNLKWNILNCERGKWNLEYNSAAVLLNIILLKYNGDDIMNQDLVLNKLLFKLLLVFEFRLSDKSLSK